jgi:beta-galactosidase/beta-glucuronidase
MEAPMSADDSLASEEPAYTRATISLDGFWDFAFEGPTARLTGDGCHICSPGIWQTRFPELRNASGTGRYRRRVEIPDDWASHSIVLVMEGVFHESTVLVDEAPVATHGDGWTPIEVDLTGALAGKRTFTVGVDARVPDDRDGAGARLSQSLIGKQDWYGLMGGIWKPARLEARNAVHFAAVAVRTSFDLKTGVVSVSGKLSRATEATTLRVSLSRGGEGVARLIFHFRSTDFEAALAVPDAAPWSPEAPNLYAAVIELISERSSTRSSESSGFGALRRGRGGFS